MKAVRIVVAMGLIAVFAGGYVSLETATFEKAPAAVSSNDLLNRIATAL